MSMYMLSKCFNFESSWLAYFLWLLLLPNMFKEKNIIGVHKTISDVVWETWSRCQYGNEYLVWAYDKAKIDGKELFIPPQSLDIGDQIVKVDYKFEKKIISLEVSRCFHVVVVVQ